MYDVFLDGNPTHGPLFFSPPSLCGGKKKESKQQQTSLVDLLFLVNVVVSTSLPVDAASTAAASTFSSVQPFTLWKVNPSMFACFLF